MKTIWYVKYDIVRKHGVKKYDNIAEAMLFSRKLISKYSEIPEYLKDMRDGRRKKFRGAVADFLEKYYSDPNFTFTESEIPSSNPEDYEEDIPAGIIFGEDLDDDAEYDYYSPDEYFEEDEFFPYIDADGFGSDGDGYDETGLPEFNCNISFDSNDELYEYREDRLFIEIYSKKFSGGRSNALLVLNSISGASPLRIEGNINRAKLSYTVDGNECFFNISDVQDKFDYMCNKTIHRCIELLRLLGYSIKEERHIVEKPGVDVFARKKRFVEYSFILTGKTDPQKPAKGSYGKSAYPIMVLRVLEDAHTPLLQSEIIKRIQNKFYGTTIHRKAVGNSIKELIEHGYGVEHTKNGYVLNQEKSLRYSRSRI